MTVASLAVFAQQLWPALLRPCRLVQRRLSHSPVTGLTAGDRLDHLLLVARCTDVVSLVDIRIVVYGAKPLLSTALTTLPLAAELAAAHQPAMTQGSAHWPHDGAVMRCNNADVLSLVRVYVLTPSVWVFAGRQRHGKALPMCWTSTSESAAESSVQDRCGAHAGCPVFPSDCVLFVLGGVSDEPFS